jgi:hypothetical protein
MICYRILETEVGESIDARTACLMNFKELGPPDLVHLSKTGKQVKEVSNDSIK